MPSLTILLMQLNTHVGDFTYNSKKISAAINQAQHRHSADVLIFSELALCGYPPEDLLLRADFLQQVQVTLAYICTQVQDVHVIIGHPQQTSQGLYNAASILHQGKIIATYHKQLLPNNSVFDEQRYFTAGQASCVLTIKNIRCGILICEDIWFPGPAAAAARQGAELLISLNASPFCRDKAQQRLQVLQQRTAEIGLPIVYVNSVGGQDELVFDGGSLALQSDGRLAAQAEFFTETALALTVVKNSNKIELLSAVPPLAPSYCEIALVYQALVLGTRDYLAKNNFKDALLGLSGGIDSALTLAIAGDALGSDNIHAVMMPSRYTAAISQQGAMEQLNTMHVSHSTISIEPIYQAYLASLAEEFKSYPPDVTEENLQSRTRGALLMALSNKTGKLVLITGNKSELAVGYTTLYGDMAGGFAPLKDVLKTQVYELAMYRNSISAIIPTLVIERPPSAELAFDQVDQDSLPPYPLLDAILKRYLEDNVSAEELVSQGFEAATVTKIIQLIKRSEYKRRQAPVGVRISKRAFGKDWRLPITSAF